MKKKIQNQLKQIHAKLDELNGGPELPITLKQLAWETKINESTLRAMRAKGDFKSHQFAPGGKIMVYRSEFNQALKNKNLVL